MKKLIIPIFLLFGAMSLQAQSSNTKLDVVSTKDIPQEMTTSVEKPKFWVIQKEDRKVKVMYKSYFDQLTPATKKHVLQNPKKYQIIND